MYLFRRVTQGFADLMYALPELGAMLVISAITAVIALLVVKLVLPPEKLKRSREQMTAAVYEIRLFLDNPARVLLAQARVVFYSFVYTAWIGLPMLVLGLPFGVLFLHLEARHSVESLPMNQGHVVMMEVSDACAGAQIELEGNDAVKVTSPPLFDASTGYVYQSIEVMQPGHHEVTVKGCGLTTTKRIDAAHEQPVSTAKVSSLALLWSLSEEPPIGDDAPVAGIWMSHDYIMDQEWMGMTMPWWVFWLIATTLIAVGLQKPMRVEL